MRRLLWMAASQLGKRHAFSILLYPFPLNMLNITRTNRSWMIWILLWVKSWSRLWKASVSLPRFAVGIEEASGSKDENLRCRPKAAEATFQAFVYHSCWGQLLLEWRLWQPVWACMERYLWWAGHGCPLVRHHGESWFWKFWSLVLVSFFQSTHDMLWRWKWMWRGSSFFNCSAKLCLQSAKCRERWHWWQHQEQLPHARLHIFLHHSRTGLWNDSSWLQLLWLWWLRGQWLRTNWRCPWRSQSMWRDRPRAQQFGEHQKCIQQDLGKARATCEFHQCSHLQSLSWLGPRQHQLARKVFEWSR